MLLQRCCNIHHLFAVSGAAAIMPPVPEGSIMLQAVMFVHT
jgi:hypothetical protein